MNYTLNYKMNIQKIVQITALSLITATASMSTFAADRDTTTEETRGAVVGGLIGAAAFGPFGAGVGAMVGGGLIGKLMGERRINGELSEALQYSQRENDKQSDHMRSAVANLNDELHKMVALQTAAINSRELPIQFKTDSSVIEIHYASQLNEFVDMLVSSADANVTLSGFADRRGDVSYNQILSEQRVNGVKQYLLEQGVQASQIITQAFGESQPLTDDETYENHFFDRRVVMQLNAGTYVDSTAAR